MTTTPTLRPMTITEILDGAFRIYRRHALTFIGIAAATQVPMLIISLLLQATIYGDALKDVMAFSTLTPTIAPGTNPMAFFPFRSYMILMVVGVLLSILQVLIAHNLLSGALARAISRSYLGEPINILDSYRMGWKAFFSLIAVSLVPLILGFLAILLLGGIMAAVIMLSTGGDTFSSLPLMIVLFLLILLFFIAIAVLMLFIYVRFLLSVQAVVLEGVGPLAALKRGWQLTSGAFWRTIGIITIMGIISYFVSGIPSSAISMMIQFGGLKNVDSILMWSMISGVIAQLGAMLALPLQFAAYTLLYYDQRVRKEAFDLELKIQQAAL